MTYIIPKTPPNYIGEHIDIIFMSSTGKTNIWDVRTKSSVYIGTIKWYTSWRKYTFWPGHVTVFDRSCLDEISTFLNHAMIAHKEKAQ